MFTHQRSFVLSSFTLFNGFLSADVPGRQEDQAGDDAGKQDQDKAHVPAGHVNDPAKDSVGGEGPEEVTKETS